VEVIDAPSRRGLKVTRTGSTYDVRNEVIDAPSRRGLKVELGLDFVDHYLAIQKIRFGASLRIETRVQPEVKYALVPCPIVQPLVENAIRHGVSRRASGGVVTVSAESLADRMEIRVIDDGIGLPPGWSLESSAGLGLSVTRERIAGPHPNGDSRFVVKRAAMAVQKWRSRCRCASQESRTMASRGERFRVLVVDDEAPARTC
jgi:LytS/YehU family sensor histidine kinase